MNQLIQALIASIATAAQQAADLQAAGGIRPDHETKWSALRVTIDQVAAAAQAVEAKAADAAPENPDAAAFEALRHSVETLGVLVDALADKVGN